MSKQEEFLKKVEQIEGKEPRQFLEMFMNRYKHEIIDFIYVTSCEHNHSDGLPNGEILHEVLGGSQLWLKDSVGKTVPIMYANYRKEIIDVWQENQRKRGVIQ